MCAGGDWEMREVVVFCSALNLGWASCTIRRRQFDRKEVPTLRAAHVKSGNFPSHSLEQLAGPYRYRQKQRELRHNSLVSRF